MIHDRPNAFGSAAGTFTTNNSLALAGATNGYTDLLSTGGIVHLGFTFNTEPATGKITIKVFGASNYGDISTASNSVGQGNLLAVQTLYANASLIGASVFPTGA